MELNEMIEIDKWAEGSWTRTVGTPSPELKDDMTDAQADAWVEWAMDNHSASTRLPLESHTILLKLGCAATRIPEDTGSNWASVTQSLWMAGVDDPRTWSEAHGHYAYPPFVDEGDTPLCPLCQPW